MLFNSFRSNLMCLFAGFNLISNSSFAQYSPPEFNEKQGVGFTLVWKDGRQAQLMQTDWSASSTAIQLKQIENECFQTAIPLNCNYNFNYKSDKVSFIWIKHPDITKLNQVVMLKNNEKDPLRPLVNETIYIDSKMSFYLPEVFNLNPDQISCQDYSWATGSKTNTPPDSLKILNWSSEFMLGNGETMVNENKTIGGIENLELIRNGNVLEFGNVGRYLDSGLGASPIGQVISWQIPTQQGESCMISMTADLNRIRNDIGSPEKEFKAEQVVRYLPFNQIQTIRVVLFSILRPDFKGFVE